MWRSLVGLARTVRRNKTRAVRRATGGVKGTNTTHCATRWAEGAQKWRKSTIYPPKPTVDWSVSACFAVRQNGAGEPDDLVMAAALAGESLKSQPDPDFTPEQRGDLYARCHRPHPDGGMNQITLGNLIDPQSGGLISRLPRGVCSGLILSPLAIRAMKPINVNSSGSGGFQSDPNKLASAINPSESPVSQAPSRREVRPWLQA